MRRWQLRRKWLQEREIVDSNLSGLAEPDYGPYKLVSA
jgi:hypothetical protein